jgi:hypothetical protein
LGGAWSCPEHGTLVERQLELENGVHQPIKLSGGRSPLLAQSARLTDVLHALAAVKPAAERTFGGGATMVLLRRSKAEGKNARNPLRGLLHDVDEHAPIAPYLGTNSPAQRR